MQGQKPENKKERYGAAFVSSVNERLANEPKKRGRPKKGAMESGNETNKVDIKGLSTEGKLIGNASLSDSDESYGISGGKRPRGRPRIHPPVENKMKKSRGRPRKETLDSKKLQEDLDSQPIVTYRMRPSSHSATVGDDQSLVKRGPGRPRKIPIASEAPTQVVEGKRKPGRPRKNPAEALKSNSEPSVRRGPGRPRKSVVISSENAVPEVKRGPGRPRKSIFDASVSTNNASTRYSQTTHSGTRTQGLTSSDTKSRKEPNTKNSTLHTTEETAKQSSERDEGSSRISNSYKSNLFSSQSYFHNGDYKSVLLNRRDIKRPKSNRGIEDTNKFAAETPKRDAHDLDLTSSAEKQIIHKGKHLRESSRSLRSMRELRSSVTSISDLSDLSQSSGSGVGGTFSPEENAINIRGSSSTSNEGQYTHTKEDIRRPNISSTSSILDSTKKKRKLKKTGTIILSEEIPKWEAAALKKRSNSESSNKSIVLDFAKSRLSSPQTELAANRPNSKNTILDDSYDTFEFSSNGNSGFVIPPDAFKSPRKIKPTVDVEKKQTGILGIIKGTAQSLQSMSRSPRHISIGKISSSLDVIDTNIQLSDNESEVNSNFSTPVASPKSVPHLRPRKQMHHFVIDDVASESESESSATQVSATHSIASNYVSQAVTGAQVQSVAPKSSRIEKLTIDKSVLLSDNFQLQDHGTPETYSSKNCDSRNQTANMEIPEPFESLPSWNSLPNTSFDNTNKDRIMLSNFLHGLLKYINVNDANLNRDIDGNINYFIQQMPGNELDMTFAEWLDHKVRELKDEYLKELVKKKELLLKQFRASEEMVKNITDGKILLELAERFEIYY
ncbi:survivin Ecym_4672 [Eremothecium cymbalariae DBVPG|uniref:Uncharacterized protein n=1 Tax=Eremothecium cymbalariae (strain CBS 270.75 / DBVPG 7215 / KCTC 17166 / NRRL Y-17582) TaxID=931890 RepID=G8JSH1_ERECY|nr:hypothetical protein Ecym_4672 [Eremothecium cymbalariae DBVPG\